MASTFKVLQNGSGQTRFLKSILRASAPVWKASRLWVWMYPLILNTTAAIAVVVGLGVKCVVHHVWGGGIVELIILVSPVHQSFGVGRFVRHDGRFSAKAQILDCYGVAINVHHGLPGLLIPLKPPIKIIKVID